jgi:hypothetical protein
MQIDIQAGNPPASPSPPIEFVNIELAPLAQGGVSISIKSTVFDEAEFDLVGRDITHERVNSLEEAFGLIREHVRFAAPHQ